MQRCRPLPHLSQMRQTAPHVPRVCGAVSLQMALAGYSQQPYPELLSRIMLHFRPSSSPTGRFVVTVAKWSGGWDLYIEGEGLNSGGGVTQVTTLDEADAQVRKYLRSIFQTDFSDAVIDIVLPDDAHELLFR